MLFEASNWGLHSCQRRDIILAYSFMSTEDSDILIHSPTALCLLYSREVCGFGGSNSLTKQKNVSSVIIVKEFHT